MSDSKSIAHSGRPGMTRRMAIFHDFQQGTSCDGCVAQAITDASGPGCIRPFEHPLLPEIEIFYGLKTKRPYIRMRTKESGLGAVVRSRERGAE